MRAVSLAALVAVWATACSGQVTGEPDGGAAGDASTGGDAALDPADAGPGADPDAGAAAPDAAPSTLIAAESGCFFEVVDTDSLYERVIGVAGTEYGWLSFDYDVTHGGWREDLYDREVLNLGLFGLKRNVPEFVGRYILGNAAQIHPSTPGLDRKSVFYGRVDLEPRPPGEGWTGYTSWRDKIPWQVGETYHIHILLDAVAGEQILEITHAGDLLKRRVAPIDYFDPSLTASTFTIDFGGIESDEREVKPLGWTFCDLEVHAEPL